MQRSKQSFGSVRKLPSGRWQARYTGPDGKAHRAPTTFDTKGDAQAFLATVRADIVREAWNPTAAKPDRDLRFGDYAQRWLDRRELADRTRVHYQRLLDRHLLPELAGVPVRQVTPDLVRDWYARTLTDRPTARAHAYALLRTIMGDAERDELVTRNPCRIRGAGGSRRVHRIEPATPAQLETIVATMPERLRVAVVLSAWGGLRYGELVELRRHDVDTRAGVVHVRRSAVRIPGEGFRVKRPKTEAGVRDVALPPHLLPAVRDHLLQHTDPGEDGLLFPARTGGHLAQSSLDRAFRPAKQAAGRPDLRWHDLRHSGAVLAAQAGATLAELMARLGHTSPGAALRYQHQAQGRDRVIADRLSELAGGGQ